MDNLFGTDGIRGVANRYPMDCETALRAGRAIAAFFDKGQNGPAKRFIIGQDTRISGDMIVGALAAGICSMGSDVYLTGVLPTPGVAHLAAANGFRAGIVVSASHNPYCDNGIKLFKQDGTKLSDQAELDIERLILDQASLKKISEGIEQPGTIRRFDDAADHYLRFLHRCLAPGLTLAGMTIAIDGSNGAASKIAPTLFGNLGAAVKSICCEPDGVNINHDCGSQHPGRLAELVVADKADIGLAFDGDADRLIAVDENGRVLSGDQVLAICARAMQDDGQLVNPVVVTTVMSNLGLGMALEKMGIRHIKTGVGDRYVSAAMLETGAVLGGEDSGHMIFLNHHTTGDGMLAALNLLTAMRLSGKPLSVLAAVMTVFPQCLINVNVSAKPEIDTVVEVKRAIESAERQLGDRGRVLVRYSGTQPQCRVMVEGPTQQATQDLCRQIASVVERELG